jgi:hypothetical protein
MILEYNEQDKTTLLNEVGFKCAVAMAAAVVEQANGLSDEEIKLILEFQDVLCKVIFNVESTEATRIIGNEVMQEMKGGSIA